MPKKQDPKPKNLYGLTDRQIEVAQCLVTHGSVKAIARHLNVQPSTVENHLMHARERTGATNSLQLAVYVDRAARMKALWGEDLKMNEMDRQFAEAMERRRAAEYNDAKRKASNKTRGSPVITSETKVTIAAPIRDRFAPVGDVPRVFELSF